jgi:hypothetical protein
MKTMKTFVKELKALGEPTEDVNVASIVWADYREDAGFAHASPPLLTPPTANMKLNKEGSVLNYGLSLSPERVSGVINLCTHSTKGCRDLCINVSGNGYYPKIQASRILKTKFFVEHPEMFLTLLHGEIKDAKALADDKDVKLAVRLNVFSDIPWERATPWLFTSNPDVVFYDYTKDDSRVDLPDNYSLTYSASERMNDDKIASHLKERRNVAIVADLIDGSVPDVWNDFPVINGDLTDYRPSDELGSIVFLKPKGRARSATKVPRGGFIRTGAGFS